MKFSRLMTCLALIAITVSSYASAPIKITAPNFSDYVKGVHKIGVLSGGAAVFEISAAGKKQFIAEWSAIAKEAIEKVSVEQLRVAGYDAQLLPIDDKSKPVVAKINSMNGDLLTRYAYSGRQLEPAVAANVKELLASGKYDALLIIRGADHVKSAGRVTANVASALFGRFESSGIAHLEVVLIDNSSAVVYYNHQYEDGKNLQTESGVKDLFGEILKELNVIRGAK